MNPKKTKTFFDGALDSLIKVTMTPLLKKVGFKKKGRCWNKQVGDLVHVIQLQVSRYNTADDGSFTLNIGVFHSQVFSIIWDKYPPRHVPIENCIFSVRVGFIDAAQQNSNDVYDIWWSIDSKTNMEALLEEIDVSISEKILPFLSRLSDAASVLECIERTNRYRNEMPLCRLNHAVLSSLVGMDKDRAIKEIEEVASGCKDWKLRCDIAKRNLAAL